jgi:glyoxylase I family protein
VERADELRGAGGGVEEGGECADDNVTSHGSMSGTHGATSGRNASSAVAAARLRTGAFLADLLELTLARSEAQMAQRTSFHGIRYQVNDVARSVRFYTEHLCFTLEHQQLPAFASVSLDDVQILLSGPGASGSRPMPDGRLQEPGGWNRVVLKVADLARAVVEFREAGVRFRNDVESGPGGRQIQIEDPDGNPIELFEPAR